MSSTQATVTAIHGLSKEAGDRIIQRQKALDAIIERIKSGVDRDVAEGAEDSTEELMFWTLFFNQGKLSNLGIEGFLYDAEKPEKLMEFAVKDEDTCHKLQALLMHKYGVKEQDIELEKNEDNRYFVVLNQQALDTLLAKAAVMPGIRNKNILDSIVSIHACYRSDAIQDLYRQMKQAESDDKKSELRAKIEAELVKCEEEYQGELVKKPFFANLKSKIDKFLKIEGSENTSPMAADHLSIENAQEAARKLLAQRTGLRSFSKRSIADISFKSAEAGDDYDYQFTIKHGEKSDEFKVNGYCYKVTEEKLERSGPGFDQSCVRFDGALTQENARNLVMLSVMRLLTCHEVKEGWRQHAYKYTLTCNSKEKRIC